MNQRKRRYYTQAEKTQMWGCWRKGESMNEIGRCFGIQGHSSIQKIFSATGSDCGHKLSGTDRVTVRHFVRRDFAN